MFVVLMLGLFLTSAANAIDPSLIGWWKLDEGVGTTVADASGRGHNGVFAEGTPEWVEGMYDKALKFDGANKVEIPDHPDFHLEDAISMALWIMPEADVQPGYAKLFMKQRSDVYPYNIQYAGNGTNIRTTVYTSGQMDTSGTPNFAGEWGHLCMTYDGSALILYKDGEEVAQIATSGKIQQNDLSLSIGGRLNSSQNFIGIIDDVKLYNRALTPADIKQAMIAPLPTLAFDPNPANGATDVPRDVVFSWTPGIFAAPINGHTVYFGENINDVKDGIGGVTQDTNSYTPPQLLDFEKTYYWRVDEVKAPPDSTIFRGDLWSFTTEPVAYAIENVSATASSSEVDKGPENTVNGSGLDDSGLLHGNVEESMWLSGRDGVQPTWIEFQFDKVYRLHEMWVWNSNDSLERVIGFGFRDVSIEYSVDGNDYTTLGTTHEFAQGYAEPDYAHNTTVDFTGVTAKYVRLTVNTNWGGILPQYGLSEVRFFYIPVAAREPDPDSGATDVAVDVILSWRAGREAAEHDVYLDTDEQAVIDGNAPVTTVTKTSYGPLSLDLGTTYYWKVNEVNMAETPAISPGDVWDFATREYSVVDDFEDYNDYPPDEIFSTWTDGWGIPTNGALIANDEAPWAETTIVHSGRQSMPYRYDNNLKYSEAERPLSPPQDWTRNGVGALSLWFYGDPNNAAERMYVAIANSPGLAAVVYHDDKNAALIDSWTEWTIELKAFADQGVDLTNIDRFSIGFGDKTNLQAGGSGLVFFDDIRLYRPSP